MNKEEEKQFNQFFNNEEHCEELNIIRYNVLKFIDENYISKAEVKEKINNFSIKHTPSDTFIEDKVKQFDNHFEAILTYWGAAGIRKDLNQFLKSSLQEARQSILEEIEKKTKIKNKLCTHEQTWYFIDGYNQALEDIKQLLKDNKE